MFKGKISIVGDGLVGSTTAYTLMLGAVASEIVILDINRDKAQGDVLDMNHGMSFISPMTIVAGDYEQIRGSDIVIITAGANQKPGETRIALLQRNTAIFKDIVQQITKYCHDDTILLVVTNPVDILTYITYKLSGFSPHKVIGSGTVLDTSRLKYMIGERAKVDLRNVHTYIIGEHGDSEVAAWSSTSIAGMSLDEFCKSCKRCDGCGLDDTEALYQAVKNAAYEIIRKKGATFYAVALAVRRIVECSIGNENSILTVSTLMQGEYGVKDVCLSLPTIVDHEGVEKVLEIQLDELETAAFRDSAQKLRKLAKEIGF